MADVHRSHWNYPLFTSLCIWRLIVFRSARQTILYRHQFNELGAHAVNDLFLGFDNAGKCQRAG